MKKIFYLKIFTFLVFLFFGMLASFASETGMNTLDRIIIEPSNQKEITLNMLFNDNYKGNAFIQKITDGSYYVFLPDSVIAKSGAKIHYSSGFDRKKIKLTVSQNEAIKGNSTTNYVRISVDMLDDYAINLVSGLDSDYNGFLMQIKSLNFVSLFALFAVAAIIYMLFRLVKRTKETIDKGNYTSVPKTFIPDFKNNNSPADKSLKSGSDNSFECFDIPVKQNKSQTSYEIESTLNQTSKLLNENSGTVRLKHTNPILKAATGTPGLLIPAVDEAEIKKQKIISKLNISHNKGFYVTSENNKTYLFGFVNDKSFLLQEFNRISQINLQARYYDKKDNKETYIVRLDNYKSMIEISEFDMRELAKI